MSDIILERREVEDPNPIIRARGFVRLSNLVRAMKQGKATLDPDALARDLSARACPECKRHEPDPIAMVLGGALVSACPHCAGESVRKRWESEVPDSFEGNGDGTGTVQVRARGLVRFVEWTENDK